LALNYVTYNSFPDTRIVDGMTKLHASIFIDSDNWIEKIESKPNLLFIIALDGVKVVGYKVGYALNDDKFYSWMGGVDATYRNSGIASMLMEKQHQYIKENGFQVVQTKTMNKWRSMLILNIKSGFDVIGTYTDDKGETKIILEKKLFN
jgi:ribosomal protein S18 acetylase RimI-like enzyme